MAILVGISIAVFLVTSAWHSDAALLSMRPAASVQGMAVTTKTPFGAGEVGFLGYFRWIGGWCIGQLGNSASEGAPTFALLVAGLRVTLPLVLLAMVLAVPLSLLAGYAAAAPRRRLADGPTAVLARLLAAIPAFWLALLPLLIVLVTARPSAATAFAGWGTGLDGILAGLWTLRLPLAALTLAQAAVMARVAQTEVREVMRASFVRSARAGGLSRWTVLWRLVLPNAAVPWLGELGWQFAELLAATVVVENVFQVRGVGWLAMQALRGNDLPLVRDCVMLLASMVVVAKLLANVAQALLDPRLCQNARLGGEPA